MLGIFHAIVRFFYSSLISFVSAEKTETNFMQTNKNLKCKYESSRHVKNQEIQLSFNGGIFHSRRNEWQHKSESEREFNCIAIKIMLQRTLLMNMHISEKERSEELMLSLTNLKCQTITIMMIKSRTVLICAMRTIVLRAGGPNRNKRESEERENKRKRFCLRGYEERNDCHDSSTDEYCPKNYYLSQNS